LRTNFLNNTNAHTTLNKEIKIGPGHLRRRFYYSQGANRYKDNLIDPDPLQNTMNTFLQDNSIYSDDLNNTPKFDDDSDWF
jgi:hypothetical protein